MVRPVDQSAAGAGRTVRIRVLGTVFRLEPKHAETADGLRREWSRCIVDERAEPDDRTLELAGELQPSTQNFGYELASDLTLSAIGDLAGRRTMLHASGLADQDGRVMALVGPSGAGKSTAVRVLAGAGLGYVTDETIAVDERGQVLPFPRPLSLAADPDRPHLKRQFGPDSLGLAPAPQQLSLCKIVLLDRRHEPVAEPALHEVPMLEALWSLLPQTSAQAKLPTPLQALCRLIATCGVHRLTYSDIESTVTLLRRHLGDRTAGAAEWHALEPYRPLGTGVTGYVSAPYLDAVQLDDGTTIVLLGDVPMQLGPVGRVIWERCRDGASRSQITKALVNEFGTPPSLSTVVDDALDAMVMSGVLRPPDRVDQ